MRGGNYVLGWLASLALAFAADLAVGQPQPQPQLQYSYDAAGNLIQITRSQATPKPDLIVRNLAVGAIAVNADGSFDIPATFQINNIGGDQAIAPWYDRGYLSVNTTLHDTDQPLAGYNTRSTSLAAEAGYSVATTFKTTTTTPAGNYFLIVRADGGAGTGQYSPTGANQVAESDETNNTQSAAIVLPANAKPDLTLTNGTVGAVTVNQDGSYAIPVTFTVTNTGIAAAAGSWYDTAYLSTDGALDNGDVNIGYVQRSGGVAAGQSYNVSTTFTTATTTNPGAYTLFLKADGHGAAVGGSNTDNGAVSESNETNNMQAISLALSKPDLAISNLVVGTIRSKSGGGYNIPVTFTVTNLGTTTASATWYDRGYLSTDAVLDNADQALGGFNTRSTNLVGGASYSVSTTQTTSATTAAGNYTLFVKTDGGASSSGQYSATGTNYVPEPSEANNVASVPVALAADLAISNVTVGTIGSNPGGGYRIPVSYTVTNVGSATATATWYDRGYLSTDAVLDNADQVLSLASTRGTDLAAGASYAVSVILTTSAATAAGYYTLFLKTDGGASSSGQYGAIGTNYVTELSETNNVASVTVALTADLAISNVVVGAITRRAGGGYNIPVTYTVTNVGNATATATWYDRGYLSTDSMLDNADQVLSLANARGADLAAGASYTVSVTLTTSTATAAGNYTLFLKTDGGANSSGQYSPTGANYVTELSETNNVASAAVTLP